MVSWSQIFPATAAAAANTLSWLQRQAPTLIIGTANTATVAAPPAIVGAAVSPSQAVLVSQGASSVNTSVSLSGTVQPVTAENVVVKSSLAAILATPVEQLRVVSTTTSLTQTTYGTGATATGGWVTPTNAIGASDSLYATDTSAMTAASNDALTVTFAPQLQKTQLTITSAALRVYWQHVGAAAVCSIDYSLNSGTSWTGLYSSAAAVNQLSGQSYTITTPVGQSWAGLTALQVRFTFVSAIGAAAETISVDAVRLLVSANQTVLS